MKHPDELKRLPGDPTDGYDPGDDEDEPATNDVGNPPKPLPGEGG
jgi:hypothetical protein